MDLKKCRILVTPTSYGSNDPRLFTELEKVVGDVIYNSTGKPLSSLDLARLLPGVDGYIAGLDTIDRKALEAADKLKVIARYGVGIENVDLELAKEKGIVVTNTPGVNAVSVAELTIALILSLARNIPAAVSATRKGEWPRFSGASLEGKTVGILGFGAIGKQVAHRLTGFDCQILACDPIADEATVSSCGAELCDIDEILARSDYVSLHIPLIPETRDLVDESFILKMKNGACLINTSRGDILNEEALLKALQTGYLKGAALDVLSKEPPDVNNPLLALPQVIATPHIGSHTDNATNAMGWMAFNACIAVLRGESPPNRVV